MKVLTQKESRKVISEAIEEAYNAVAHTLGPRGTNAIAKISGKQTVTNDGVSIIKSLELDGDKNIPLSIIKEACFNAEKKSGDGTTTAIVLIKAILDEAYKSETNKVILKRVITKASKIIENEIRNRAVPVKNLEDILNIATISSGGNRKVGKIITKAFEEVNLKGTVDYILDPSSEEIRVEKTTGYKIPSENLSSDYYLNKEYDNIPIVIYEGTISTTAELQNLAAYNREYNQNRPMIIISNFERDALNGIYYYNNSGNRIIGYNLPAYSREREDSLNEIRFLTDTKILNKDIPIRNFDIDEIGKAVGNILSCKLNQDSLLLTKVDEEKYNILLEHLKDKNQERYNILKNGVATIFIGGKTAVEAEEMELRIQDAVNSIRLALAGGIVISGASTLAKLTNLLLDTEGNQILNEALKRPLRIILESCGNDEENIDFIIDKLIVEKSETIGFNAEDNSVCDLLKAGVIDPAETVINSLKSAVSIATSLLTINSIITE